MVQGIWMQGWWKDLQGKVIGVKGNTNWLYDKGEHPWGGNWNVKGWGVFPMVRINIYYGKNGLGGECDQMSGCGEGTGNDGTYIDICNISDQYKNTKMNQTKIMNFTLKGYANPKWRWLLSFLGRHCGNTTTLILISYN